MKKDLDNSCSIKESKSLPATIKEGENGKQV